jgi:hypothetical protein
MPAMAVQKERIPENKNSFFPTFDCNPKAITPDSLALSQSAPHPASRDGTARIPEF